MSPSQPHRDPRLRAVEWRDLTQLTAARKIYEVLLSVPWLVAAIALSIASWAPESLQWFVAAMIAGECLTGFFAVWTVHHDCEPEAQVARTQRGAWKNLVSYEMFYHLEHHLFPAVPTSRLPELAARLDKVIPQVTAKQVF